MILGVVFLEPHQRIQLFRILLVAVADALLDVVAIPLSLHHKFLSLLFNPLLLELYHIFFVVWITNYVLPKSFLLGAGSLVVCRAGRCAQLDMRAWVELLLLLQEILLAHAG